MRYLLGILLVHKSKGRVKLTPQTSSEAVLKLKDSPLIEEEKDKELP